MSLGIKQRKIQAGRSFVTWLHWGRPGKLLAIHGIPSTKATACLYLIGLVIRAAVDAVPKRKNEKEALPADEFGLPVSQNSLAHRRNQIVERTNPALGDCGIVLQFLGFAARLAIMLWISFTLLKPLEEHTFLKPVSFWINPALWNLSKTRPRASVALILDLVLYILICLSAAVTVIGCYFGVGCVATMLGLENLEFEKPNMLRIILYTFAPVLLLTALAFYARLYDRSGISKAGVREAPG